MDIYWIFFFIIIFCTYILIGLYITEGIETLSTLILTWIIYTCLWMTFTNVFLLSYFWSSIRLKRGPPGIRGPEGENGTTGLDGTCSITSAQAIIMQQLNTYLDTLYKNKTGNNLLNQTTQKFPNNYLNNKITLMAGSRQFKVVLATLSTQNKPVNDLLNYLQSIWIIWFDLIYNANPEWFLDEYGDEDYSWTTDNPFTEIRKYDIYYWGITRSFRPLRAEICRSTPNYESSKLPIKPTARLKVIQTNDYEFVGDDYKTGAAIDTSWWRPRIQTIGSETYYPVGDIITAGDSSEVYHNINKVGKTILGDIQMDTPQLPRDDNERGNGPDMRTILVSGDVKSPIGYPYSDAAGNIYGSYEGGDNKLSIGNPKCPDGYIAIGNVVYKGKWNKNVDNIRCLPRECVDWNGKNLQSFQNPWTGKTMINTLNNWKSGNYDANVDNGYNLMQGSNSKYGFWRILDKCLEPPATPATKDPEPEYNDLAIGWFGHPYKLDPKYSIFTFLNLVPEGMIVSKSSGRRFYIIHYGGEDVNIYNILSYNMEADKFNYGLQVDSNTSSAVKSRPLSRRDERQQWNIILQTDKRFMKLKNIMNNKYLYIGLEPVKGNAEFSTIDMDFNNYKTNPKTSPIYNNLSDTQIEDNTLFSFISTYGTQMNIIDNITTKTTTILGNRIRIMSQRKQPLNLFGIFIYDSEGKSLSMDIKNATCSSIYKSHRASNTLKITMENTSRNINQAINGVDLIGKTPGWNNWSANNSYCTHTNNDGKAETGGDWWEYNFQQPVNINAIELYGRSDCCIERMQNMIIQIFNGDKLVWEGNTGTDDMQNARKLFIIEKNGIIHTSKM